MIFWTHRIVLVIIIFHAHAGLGGNPATAGLNAGVMGKFSTVTGSNTAEVINIDTTTNIDIPGIWAFQVNEGQVLGML